MAKAAAINLSDAFSPPQTQVVNTQSTYGDFLPSLSNSASLGPGSEAIAAKRLSGQVLAVSSAKERSSSSNSRKHSARGGSFPPQPGSAQFSDGPLGGQQNAKLPPLMHGYGAGPSSAGLSRVTPQSAGSQQPPLSMEPLQPVTQHPVMLHGPLPASHPYQPKRKPPSAFMRNNPMRQQLESNQAHHRAGSAGNMRSYAAAYENLQAPLSSDAATAALQYGLQQQQQQQQLQQQQQFAEEVIAAAQAAMMQQDPQQQQWGEGDSGGGGAGGYTAAPPWGVSSVSDLEALDSILDQLVVVDARMRKALLKGPLISFETVVPEHVMSAARGPQPTQQRPGGTEEEAERTFMTAVRGMAVEEGGAEAGEVEAEMEPQAVADVPPPSPTPVEEAPASVMPVQQVARRPSRSTEETPEPRDSSLFPASIPNPGMHPTFTRAYLTSKLVAKPQHLSPPPPATAEHLLRSRPPPFIAAPSYDQLCSQIRDVQRQYTCGTSRGTTAQSTNPGGAAGAAVGVVGAANSAPVTNQYIAGLDGPTLEEVVAHQELPIGLERVRPTFVALKQKGSRAASPRRRPGSPGRGQGAGLDGPADDFGLVAGRTG